MSHGEDLNISNKIFCLIKIESWFSCMNSNQKLVLTFSSSLFNRPLKLKGKRCIAKVLMRWNVFKRSFSVYKIIIMVKGALIPEATKFHQDTSGQLYEVVKTRHFNKNKKIMNFWQILPITQVQDSISNAITYWFNFTS